MVAVLRKVYGGCMIPAKSVRGIREASKVGRMGKVRIIHGLNISHKQLIYLLQKSTSHQKPKYYAHAPRGIDW